ncbi:hypothetical protein BJL95_16525 [Methylomonas sp. LWB]|uniref:hypothetical protein n=1 Tax=Methylomonas sp. LWB TaxID=1905845 RepID=UPI0008DA3B2F|nr:hypothetical protein [Methylomonas sp. LWB]OHX35015.1 hypothetical protein BJL95_16525 [Methylomonas sp. LWB]
MALWKKTVAMSALLVALVAITLISSPKANYIWKAYFYPGSNSNLRGYPTLEPPNNFTGTWVHYAYTGRSLAKLNIVDGKAVGKQIYFADDGSPYLVRYLRNGKWERDEINLGPPASIIVPWFLPQRWINRSLNRFAILDWFFPESPAVYITEEKTEKQAK